mmetsp:Transcript_24053/g.55553  ORF Transcript_24053/g.55553 Transcript_24053/m.55553 type:complete len:257 (-) Transcript_24053:555-1325(-)
MLLHQLATRHQWQRTPLLVEATLHQAVLTLATHHQIRIIRHLPDIHPQAILTLPLMQLTLLLSMGLLLQVIHHQDIHHHQGIILLQGMGPRHLVTQLHHLHEEIRPEEGRREVVDLEAEATTTGVDRVVEQGTTEDRQCGTQGIPRVECSSGFRSILAGCPSGWKASIPEAVWHHLQMSVYLWSQAPSPRSTLIRSSVSFAQFPVLATRKRSVKRSAPRNWQTRWTCCRSMTRKLGAKCHQQKTLSGRWSQGTWSV